MRHRVRHGRVRDCFENRTKTTEARRRNRYRGRYRDRYGNADQLRSHCSDQPDEPDLWELPRFVQEVDSAGSINPIHGDYG